MSSIGILTRPCLPVLFRSCELDKTMITLSANENGYQLNEKIPFDQVPSINCSTKIVTRAFQFILMLATVLLWANFAKADDYERAFDALSAEDYQTAAYYLSFFASNGDVRSQYNMGIMYRDGLGLEKNSRVALSWFLLAAEQNHMLANYAIGLLLRDGPADVKHPKRASLYLKEAAFLGHALAPLELGNMFFSGNHVSKDRALAFVWWSLSAERNAPGAEANIAALTDSLSIEEMTRIQKILKRCDEQPLRSCL